MCKNKGQEGECRVVKESETCDERVAKKGN